MIDQMETTRTPPMPLERRGSGADELSTLLRGLSGPGKRISSKYHYDERGSRLFEEITELDEYYLTRTERGLLERWIPQWVAELGPRTLIELGAGSAEKSRIILDAMTGERGSQAYVPVDVSRTFLRKTSEALREEYPHLLVVPEAHDIAEPLEFSGNLPCPRWIAFLGSTLGNFDDAQATSLLRRVATRLGPDDLFVLGVDLRPGKKKTVQRVEAAYDDARGVTARFTLNILSVLNDRFGSDFDLSAFRHRSGYDAETGRIETFLDSLRNQVVRFPGGGLVSIAEGEAIRTEISAKYDRPAIDALFDQAGLAVSRWVEDADQLYALILGRAVP